MHEILTVQLGHAANYLGAHYWNAQQAYFTFGEEVEPSPIDHDIHFRAGRGPYGEETYTPRTVVYDLKGGFGSLKRVNELYEVEGSDDPHQALWDHGVQAIREPMITQSEYIKSLNVGEELQRPTISSVRYWSDFNSVFLHPKSIVQCYEYELQSAARPFESYHHGKELFKSTDKEHDVFDRDFRFFLEETDLLQGVQIFTSVDDGWGGFASEYVATLRDEFPKTQIWTWAIERNEKAAARERRILRTINASHALSSMVPMSSIYVPLLNPPRKYPHWIDVDENSQWHTSALWSAAVETSTIPARFKDWKQGCQLSDLAETLNVSGKNNIALLSLSILDTEEDSEEGTEADDSKMPRKEKEEEKKKSEESDKPMTKPHKQKMLESVDLSWTGKEKQIFATVEVYRSPLEPALTPLNPIDLEKERNTIYSRYHTVLTYPQQPSYPKIFRIKQPNLCLCSRLRTSDAVMDRLRLMKETVTKHAEVEDRETLKDDLSSLCEAYKNGWVSDTDSGDDD